MDVFDLRIRRSDIVTAPLTKLTGEHLDQAIPSRTTVSSTALVCLWFAIERTPVENVGSCEVISAELLGLVLDGLGV